MDPSPSLPPSFEVVPDDPPEMVLGAEAMPCPYLPDRVARLAARLPLRRLDGPQLDRRLARGDRRHGSLLYRPACPACSACEPLRLRLGDFRAGRSQRRALRRGDERLEVELGPVLVDRERVDLFQRHKHGRGLTSADDGGLDMASYRAFLVESCCVGFELRCRLDGRLVSVAITDRGRESLSAVYTFFDPDLTDCSLGVYSILKQVELARAWGMRFVYLGFAIGECAAMSYKLRYRPHERLIDGRWARFGRGPGVGHPQ